MPEYSRKKRTRSHVIAELSENHVQYFALQCGFSVEHIENDYGYDLELYSYNIDGEIENGLAYLQLKSTDHIERYEREWGFSYTVETAHLKTWLNEPMPVILVLFDVEKEIAYWVYIQAYFEQKGISLDAIKQETFTIHLDKKNILNTKAIMKWKEYKDNVLSQLDGYIKHHA
jgi:hypothetical protein